MLLEKEHPSIFEQFTLGNHTVRRTEKIWSGIWTDLSIEQILMKSLKGRGSVIGKGMSDNVLTVWTKTMHRCAEISERMNEITSATYESQTHKEMQPGRIKRDNIDFEKIQSWFRSHNPFTYGENLVSLDSGLVDEKKRVNCDRSGEVGAVIQKALDGKSFSTCTFKRKDQIITLQSLYSSVTIEKEVVAIDPLTLFLRF